MLPVMLVDDLVPELAPLCDLRASFDVRTGACTMVERLGLMGARVVGVQVRGEIAEITRERHAGVEVNGGGAAPGVDGEVVLVNGRWGGLTREGLERAGRGERLVDEHGQWLAERAGVTGAAGAWSRAAVLATGASAFNLLRQAPNATLTGLQALTRPWHVRALRDFNLDQDLKAMAAASRPWQPVPPAGCLAFGTHVLRVSPTAKIYPGVVFDTEGGAIVIDEHAVVRPGSTIIGPAYVGPHSHVLDRSLIKAHSAIGPWCKVAGEVGGTIFQGFANKAHDGHLGDSWVGEWANLGAGTTNSNLLNTYAEVTARALPGGKTERTGQQFLGAIIGDHVKTAICTRLMTGVVVHTGAMIAQSVAASGCIGRFAWMSDGGGGGGGGGGAGEGGGPRRFRADKFVEIARTVMGRRKVALSAAYAGRLGELLRADERAGGVSA